MARPWLAAEMTRESHLVHCKERRRSTGKGWGGMGWGEGNGGRGEGRRSGVWKADQTERTEPGSRAGRGADSGHCGEVAPGAAAHLSLPFWMEAWPRLALSKSGEFLLRFVLVERTLFCGGDRAGYRKPVFAPRAHSTPSPTSPRAGPGWEQRLLFLGARLSK